MTFITKAIKKFFRFFFRQTVSDYPTTLPGIGYEIPAEDAPFQKHEAHVLSQVAVGPFTVSVSGSQYITEPEDFEVQGHGFFLDRNSWSAILEDSENTDRDATVIDWPDFGVLDLKEFALTINEITTKLLAGESVHIGCIGAHGRTGTLLAGLTVAVEGCNGPEAIRRVRVRYCKHAVETDAQKFLIDQLVHRT